MFVFINSKEDVDKLKSGKSIKSEDDGSLYFGLELEYEFGSRKERIYEKFIREARKNRAVIIEGDDSLNYPSCEMITNPVKLEILPYLLANLDLPPEKKARNGVGLHINVSRNWFTNPDALNLVHKILNSIKPIAKKIARRSSPCYAKFLKQEFISNNKFVSVGLRPQRLEFRIFKTTYKKEEILDCCEFVYAICKAAKGNAWRKIGILTVLDGFKMLIAAHPPVEDVIKKYVSKEELERYLKV